MLNLITDRTSEDVQNAKIMINKARKVEDLTQEEFDEYVAGLKGCYNISDLNRVENAVQYLSNLLNSLGYTNTVNVKTWTEGDFLTPSEVTRYLNNISILRNAYYVKTNTPSTPNSYKPYGKANDIEKILMDIEELVENMQISWKYVGEVISGEGYMS